MDSGKFFWTEVSTWHCYIPAHLQSITVHIKVIIVIYYLYVGCISSMFICRETPRVADFQEQTKREQ